MGHRGELVTVRGCPPVVLASSSPRRKELFAHFGVPFTVKVPDVDESLLPGEEPSDHVGRLAVEKARAVAEGISRGLVIAADTIVVINGEIIGKPEGREEARRMLGRIAGRTHHVYSGVVVTDAASGETRAAVVRSRVTMTPMEETEIERYVDTGEPLDKAGSYAVQGKGGRYVTEIEGSFTNVVGLPLKELQRLLLLSGCRVSLPDMRF